MTRPHTAGHLFGKRVLVVEDVYFIADDLRQALAGAGAEVVGPLAEVRQAHAVLEAGLALDAAVLDVNLQDERIYPVAEMLLARGVPVVFATGYGQAAIPHRFAAVPLWEKPYDYEHLVADLGNRLRPSRHG